MGEFGPSLAEFEERLWQSEVGKRGKELLELTSELRRDVHNSHLAAQEHDDPFNRRQFVRSLFAYIEGSIHALKQKVLSTNTKFSAAERAMLTEELYDLNDKGKAITQQKFIPTNKNIKYAFTMFAKSLGSDYALPVQETGWNSLKLSIKVRNRLMHPKRSTDLNVTNAEFKKAEEAYNWFEQKQDELWTLMRRKLIEDIFEVPPEKAEKFNLKLVY